METMTEPQTTVSHQLCRRCNGKLAFDDKRKCSYCPACYPPGRQQKVVPVEQKPYLDVKMTDKRVIELINEHVPSMIRKELENWHIQKPPVTVEEVKEEVKDLVNNLDLGSDTNNVPTESKPETFLEKAKRMGIATHYEVDGVMSGGMRKKVDVMADIAKKESTDEEL